MTAEQWIAELREWCASHAVTPEADDSRESIYADPSDLELASATAACMMPTLDRLWDNSKCDPTMGPLVAGVRKVARVLASATPMHPALPTREAVAQAIDAVPTNFDRLTDLRLAQADAVIALLRPVELNEEELAFQVCKAFYPNVGFGTSGVQERCMEAARKVVAYVHEKMGWGERKADKRSLTPPSVASPPYEPASDAPPAPSLFTRWAGDAAPIDPVLQNPPAPPHPGFPGPDDKVVLQDDAARRAALVAECKAKCRLCRQIATPADNSFWSQPISDCDANDIRRQIAALDEEAKRGSSSK